MNFTTRSIEAQSCACCVVFNPLFALSICASPTVGRSRCIGRGRLPAGPLVGNVCFANVIQYD